MDENFSFYDVIANIVPGLLAVGLLIGLFDVFGVFFVFNFPEIFGVALGLAVAYASGNVLQALSSFLEPVYFILWGGKPSENLLSGRNRMLGSYRGEICARLKKSFEIESKDEAEENKEIFTRAMALVNAEKIGRAEAFNASYAFHRALLTTALIIATCLSVIVCLSVIDLVSLSENEQSMVIIMILAWAGGLVEFFRARQRGYYFAKEVIYLSYHHLTTSGGTNAKSSSH